MGNVTIWPTQMAAMGARSRMPNRMPTGSGRLGFRARSRKALESLRKPGSGLPLDIAGRSATAEGFSGERPGDRPSFGHGAAIEGLYDRVGGSKRAFDAHDDVVDDRWIHRELAVGEELHEHAAQEAVVGRTERHQARRAQT